MLSVNYSSINMTICNDILMIVTACNINAGLILVYMATDKSLRNVQFAITVERNCTFCLYADIMKTLEI